MIDKEIKGKTFLTGKWPLSKKLPTILFIHGAGCSSIFWKFQLENLPQTFNLIAIDLPGHGRNSSKACNSIDTYKMFVEELISDLELENVILCGHSMGGAVTLKLLLENGDIYKAGVLSNTGAKLRVHSMIFDMIRDDFDGYVKSFDFAALAKDSDRKRLAFLNDDLKNNGKETAFADFEACNTFDVTERLNEISVPVLVLTGEEDKLTPKKFGKSVAGSIKNSVYENDLKSGHMTPAESPEYFNRILLRFIETQNL